MLTALEGCCLQDGRSLGVAAEPLREPRLAPELRCCLQEHAVRGREATRLQGRVLDLMLGCCLQDFGDVAYGRGISAGADSARRRKGARGGTASSSRDVLYATGARFAGTFRRSSDRLQSSFGGSWNAVVVGNRLG